jgi:hypothetical protein
MNWRREDLEKVICLIMVYQRIAIRPDNCKSLSPRNDLIAGLPALCQNAAVIPP